MPELTDRQQEIQVLLDQDKTPGEIAKALGITENAVYQHLRRMREKLGTTTPRRRSPQRQSTRKAAAPSAPTAEPRNMTPLQAIRARKAIIEHDLKAARTEVATAEKMLANAQEALAKREQTHADELRQLDNAEAALTGKPAPARAAKRSTRKPPNRTYKRSSTSVAAAKRTVANAEPTENGNAPEAQTETPAS